MTHGIDVAEFNSRKQRGYSKSEAVRIRDTWVHSILTTFFPLSNEEPQHPRAGQGDADHHYQQQRRHLRRLLVILNPSAGNGNATRTMSSTVGPMLKEAGIEYDVLITERQGHAHEIVQAEPNLAKR